jgi:polar amino acid transport system substrate-binding protein
VRRVVPVVLAALVVAGVAAAAPNDIPTRKHGVLTVGLNPPAVGFQVGTLRGNKVLNPRGFEIDLAKAIMKRLDNEVVKIEYINVPFSGLFKAGPKSFDFAFEEATITAQRKRVVDFSTPYFDANQGVLLKKGAKVPHSLRALKKMQTCGQKVTTGLDFILHKLHPVKKPLVYDTTAAAFTAVQFGRCDAFVMDVPIIASQKKTKPSAYGPIAGQIITNEKYGAVLPKGSKLTPLLNSAIAALRENGTIGGLQKKWFNINVAKLPVLK